MNDDANRLLIVLVAAAWIVLMAAVIFVAWARPDQAIDRLGDFVEFLDDNQTDAGKLIVTLAALATAILALLVIIVEFGPEDEPSELRVEQGGATTIIPAESLRLRLEEAVLSLPDVTAARSRVRTKSRGIAADLDLTVTHEANLANVTQEAARVVVDTVQSDLGLPVAAMPKIRIAFGGSRAHPAEPPAATWQEEPELGAVETVDERMSGVSTGDEPPAAQPGASPGPLVYGQGAPAEDQGEETPRP